MQVILAILHIKHRIRALRLLVVSRGQIHNHIPRIGQIPALECLMQAQAGMGCGLKRGRSAFWWKWLRL